MPAGILQCRQVRDQVIGDLGLAQKRNDDRYPGPDLRVGGRRRWRPAHQQRRHLEPAHRHEHEGAQPEQNRQHRNRKEGEQDHKRRRATGNRPRDMPGRPAPDAQFRVGPCLRHPRQAIGPAFHDRALHRVFFCDRHPDRPEFRLQRRTHLLEAIRPRRRHDHPAPLLPPGHQAVAQTPVRAHALHQVQIQPRTRKRHPPDALLKRQPRCHDAFVNKTPRNQDRPQRRFLVRLFLKRGIQPMRIKRPQGQQDLPDPLGRERRCHVQNAKLCMGTEGLDPLRRQKKKRRLADLDGHRPPTATRNKVNSSLPRGGLTAS